MRAAACLARLGWLDRPPVIARFDCLLGTATGAGKLDVVRPFAFRTAAAPAICIEDRAIRRTQVRPNRTSSGLVVILSPRPALAVVSGCKPTPLISVLKNADANCVLLAVMPTTWCLRYVSPGHGHAIWGRRPARYGRVFQGVEAVGRRSWPARFLYLDLLCR